MSVYDVKMLKEGKKALYGNVNGFSYICRFKLFLIYIINELINYSETAFLKRVGKHEYVAKIASGVALC